VAGFFVGRIWVVQTDLRPGNDLTVRRWIYQEVIYRKAQHWAGLWIGAV